MATLQKSLVEGGVVFCWSKEARAQGLEIRDMERYMVVSSGATHEGAHGRELWAS